MHWNDYEPELRKRANYIPGGTTVADILVEALEPAENQKILDLCPGPGILPSLIAKEFGAELTVLASNSDEERLAESTAQALGVLSRVRVIPGSVSAIPIAAEEFDRIYGMAYPFSPVASPTNAREVYRVLAPHGSVCFAGPAAFRNDTPEYFEHVLSEFDNVSVRTPAYTALMYSREGFHIIAAEYINGAWDRWLEWLEVAPPELLSENLRRAIIEDGGRWLSLGLITLRKPPRPSWAI
jgi:ubiquinone/menaquinone biosynthesis C-methylase UbiE